MAWGDGAEVELGWTSALNSKVPLLVGTIYTSETIRPCSCCCARKTQVSMASSVGACPTVTLRDLTTGRSHFYLAAHGPVAGMSWKWYSLSTSTTPWRPVSVCMRTKSSPQPAVFGLDNYSCGVDPGHGQDR